MTGGERRISGAGETQRVATDGLVWGIRESFVGYVLGSKGSIAVTGEVGALGDAGPFHFPVADVSGFDAATGRGIVAFTGSVRFTAHFGMLVVELGDPVLEFGDEVVLTVRDGAGARRRLAVGEGVAPTTAEVLGVPVLGWDSIPTVLDPESAGLFNDVYPAGSEMDELHVRIALDRVSSA